MCICISSLCIAGFVNTRKLREKNISIIKSYIQVYLVLIQGVILIAILESEFLLIYMAIVIHLIGVFAFLWINMVKLQLVIHRPVSSFNLISYVCGCNFNLILLIKISYVEEK